jgi:hypothetical protein
MNAKNVILFLSVILVIVGGLYFIQNKNQDKELADHNMQRFQQMTDVAQKSSRAGLLEMASAINQFHQTKGQYPNELMDLYPEFIPEKSFISAPNWKYSPGDESYLLQKSAAGEQIFASIGPDLRLKSGIPKNQVAAVSKPPQQQQSLEKKDIPKLPKIEPEVKTSTTPEVMKTQVASKTAVPLKNLPVPTKKKIPEPEPQLSIVKKELSHKEKFLLSFDENRFYIWKGQDGFIGFSDTQYPDEKKLSIYRDQAWIEYTY